MGVTAQRPAGSALPIVDGQAPRATEEQRKFRPDIYWYLSFRCNLACKHCSVFSSPTIDTSNDLTTEECLRVVDQMAELNVRCAILTGGEVLIRPDALTIMEAIAERGMMVGLETNGLRFTQPFIDLARRLQARSRMSMTISVDGGTAEAHDTLRGPGAFDRTVRGLRKISEQGLRFSVQAVLNRSNVSTIPDLYRLAGELRPGLKNLMFGFLNPVGRGDELVAELGLRAQDLALCFELIRRSKDGFENTTIVKLPPAAIPPRYASMVYHSTNVKGCVTCQFPLLGVLPDGDVTICAVSRDNQSLHYGNVRTGRLKDMWLQGRIDLLRSEYVAAEHMTGICGDCMFQKACKGGCRAWAYEVGDSFDAPFPICQSMADSGTFPESYRISNQKKLIDQGSHLRPEDGIGVEAGCSCT